jgi:Response regulators consisting of a CheY-like receiver domain and a winged-helix DNA-binding domain
MSPKIESSHDNTKGGLWIAENAATLPHHPGERAEKLPASFSYEYRALTELCASMSSGFMLLNPAERVAYSNDSALRLLRLYQQDHATLQDFDMQKHLLSIASDPQRARSELEYSWLHPDQEVSAELALAGAAVNWLRVRSFPVRNGRGQLLGRGVLLDDITLEHTAVDARAETLMMAAHELKTPLAIIKGCATTLLGGSARWDPAMQREMLQMIDAQSDRLYDVLNTLLDVWRFDAGTQPLRLSQVQFTELLLQLVTRWQKQAPEHRFILDLPKEVAAVTCDALRIEQVLNHLLNNAVTFSATDKIVRIQLEANDDEIRVSVADEGIGIAPEYLERIFDRFYRIPAEEKRLRATSAQSDADDSLARHNGSGLGLAAARATIEAHKGKIWAESVGAGQGAIFYFTLPYTAQSMTLLPASPASGLPEQAGSQPVVKPYTSSLKQERRTRVLLAENDARLTRYIRANLEEQQYRVLTVTHGLQFLRQLDLEDPDLIILSTHLTDMSGVELLQRLREFSPAPVMVLSDACEEDERVQLFDLGCDDLMLKPFGMRELLARVRALLRRRSSHAERPQMQTTFTTGELSIDFAQHQVCVQGRPVQLSRTEYRLLSTLAQSVGLVVTHELLLEKVWGPEYNRDIDFIWVYISRLRRKIETNSRRPAYILTVPDVGYKLAKL